MFKRLYAKCLIKSRHIKARFSPLRTAVCMSAWISVLCGFQQQKWCVSHDCLSWDRAVVAKRRCFHLFQILITLKIGHCFLLSKYKNTFILDKNVYSGKLSSMHSLGVWKRRFSSRVCVVLYDWCGDCSLGWVHESWDKRPHLIPSLTGICRPGFKIFAASLKSLSAISPLVLGWHRDDHLSLSFWMELIRLLW